MVPGKVVSVIITGKLNLNLSYILIYSEEEHVKVFSVMGNEHQIGIWLHCIYHTITIIWWQPF